MTAARCPRCTAVLERSGNDTINRCLACSAILPAAAFGAEPKAARVQIDPKEARLRTARALSKSGRNWLPGSPQLIYYPFAPTGSSRQPFTPVTQLPPLLSEGWRQTGVEPLGLRGGSASFEPLLATAVRAPIELPLAKTSGTVHYPFYRLPLTQDGEVIVVWCDAVTGEVILPLDLTSPPVIRERSRWARLSLGAGAAGLLSAIVLPLPAAAAVMIGVASVIWWISDSP